MSTPAPTPAPTPTVEVLLATYNGEAFLPELLASLRAQTFPDFRVRVRDDGSTDGTLRIVREAAATPGPEIVLEDEGTPRTRLGPPLSFGRLMELSEADYVLPCDQDDVWHPDKVRVTLDAMRATEGEAGSDAPVLVHTDLRVVDRELRQLGSSFWSYQNLRPHLTRHLGRNLVQNGVVGCTLMANRPLLRRALPIPAEALMHDWWLALVAAAFGRVVPVPRATVDYRQHGANEAGALRWSSGHLLRKSMRFLDRSELLETLAEARTQGAAFLERYRADLTEEQRATVEAFVQMDRAGFWGRRRAALRHGLLKHGLVRNLAFLARI